MAETELAMQSRSWIRRVVLISLVVLELAVTDAPGAEQPRVVPTTQKSGTEVTLMSVYFLDAKVGWAVGAGGTILKPATDAFWGGYTGYFADPDGYPWEVAWNPGFPLDAEGRVQLPD